MDTLLNYAPIIVLFLISFVFFRNWISRESTGTESDTLVISLRTLKALSWILVVFGVAIPVIARFEGKELEPWLFLLILVGVMGDRVVQITKSLQGRIEALESTVREETGKKVR